MAGSASASAAMHLRMSPMGGTPSSVRSLPDEPPSSATVTTAVMLLVTSLRPRSSTDKPGAAADGHDARAARAQSPLIEHLGDRLVARPVRLDERAHDAPRTVDEQRQLRSRRRPKRARRVQELQCQQADQVGCRPCP